MRHWDWCNQAVARLGRYLYVLSASLTSPCTSQLLPIPSRTKNTPGQRSEERKIKVKTHAVQLSRYNRPGRFFCCSRPPRSSGAWGQSLRIHAQSQGVTMPLSALLTTQFCAEGLIALNTIETVAAADAYSASRPPICGRGCCVVMWERALRAAVP